MVDGWTSTLDTLFIFAGLFSAVVATFLSLTAQSLQQDYSAVTASLLTEMVSLQRATAIGGNLSAIPRSDLNYNSTFTSSLRDVWINSLWLASLSLTLSVALMAGLIKQWLHYYLADITGTTPRVRALTRQFRYRGLIRWGVPPIIESLPVLMNASLFLFFIGLVLFTRDLSGIVGITWFLACITAVAFVIYVGSSFIPVWEPQCPYKTSLSKIYNGVVGVVWYFVRKLSFGDVESGRGEDEEQDSSTSSNTKWNTKSHLRHYSTWLKGLIIKVLSHGSSLRTAESEAVVNQGPSLIQDVITEMSLNSTNPSVSAIAFQSLAASHAFEMHQVSLGLSDSLIEKLRDYFRGCFQCDDSGDWGYSVASVAERYSRAMPRFPDHFSHEDDDWFRLSSFCPPDSLRTAVILASTARGANIPEFLQHAIQFLLDSPSIEVSKAIPWHHCQFMKVVEAAESDLYSIDEQKQLLVTLFKKLSHPWNALTLQEDLLIRCLYSYRIKADIIEPLQEQASSKDSEMYYDFTRRCREALLQLVTLLPDIHDCALSLGSEEEERLLWHLLWVIFEESADGIIIFWGGWNWSVNSGFSLCVNPLIKLLNRLAASWESWNGLVFLRLKVVTNLHRILWARGKCDGDVNDAMFHWLLVLSLTVWGCPGTSDRFIRREEVEDALLESVFLFPEVYSITSLRQCCSFIASRQLVGLPSRIMDRLIALFKHSLKESLNKPDVLGCLNTLFCHFIEQEPLYINPVYPMTRVDQSYTLATLIDLAQSRQFHLAKSEELLSNWRVLINNKILGVSMNSEIDPWDLRDTLWMFEEEEYTDPWDLQDVLWIFEEQIPFEGPLNLRGLLWKIDRALESSIDLHDATWLFQDAPDEQYPPVDNPNPETNKISTSKPDVELETKLWDDSRKRCGVT